MASALSMCALGKILHAVHNVVAAVVNYHLAPGNNNERHKRTGRLSSEQAHTTYRASICLCKLHQRDAQ
jgi:hypothetical protein